MVIFIIIMQLIQISGTIYLFVKNIQYLKSNTQLIKTLIMIENQNDKLTKCNKLLKEQNILLQKRINPSLGE